MRSVAILAVAALCLTACAMTPQQAEPTIAMLTGSKWQLVHFQSSDDAIGTKVPPSVERYNIEFLADGNAKLELDCNRARSQWKAVPSSSRGGSLALTSGPMTRAMCGPGAMDTQIARDLNRIRSYTVEGGRLNLALEADGGIYVWQKMD